MVPTSSEISGVHWQKPFWRQLPEQQSESQLQMTPLSRQQVSLDPQSRAPQQPASEAQAPPWSEQQAPSSQMPSQQSHLSVQAPSAGWQLQNPVTSQTPEQQSVGAWQGSLRRRQQPAVRHSLHPQHSVLDWQFVVG